MGTEGTARLLLALLSSLSLSFLLSSSLSLFLLLLHPLPFYLFTLPSLSPPFISHLVLSLLSLSLRSLLFPLFILSPFSPLLSPVTVFQTSFTHSWHLVALKAQHIHNPAVLLPSWNQGPESTLEWRSQFSPSNTSPWAIFLLSVIFCMMNTVASPQLIPEGQRGIGVGEG